MNTFTAGSCIRFGWETFKKRGWFLIVASLIYLVVIVVATTAVTYLIAQGGAIGFIGLLLRIAVQILAGMAILSFALKAHDDIEHASLADLWRPRPFWKFTGATLLFGIICVIGFILVIIPGIIWAIMFGYTSYLVLDKGMWPMEALKQSKRMTHGYKWELFLLGILTFLISVLGVICLGVGILAAMPIVTIANVHAFRMLQQKAEASASAA